MSRETITAKVALAYLNERFGGKADTETLINHFGTIDGYIFKIGRSQHTAFGVMVETFPLTLWADAIEYAIAKRQRNAAAKREQRMVAAYVSEGLGE